jgi:hypothetical protein
MLTPEEQERRAYANGDVRMAELLARVVDDESLAEELQRTVELLKRTEDELEDAREESAKSRERIATLQALIESVRDHLKGAN